MSYEDDLFTALGPLVGGRVRPIVFLTLPTWPAIRYTIVDSVPEQDICGDGDDSTANVRVQLDIIESGYAAMKALRLQVMAAMRSFVPPARLEVSFEDFDEETKTYRATLDYSLHGSSP